MKINNEINTKFRAQINGVKFIDEDVYNCVLDILDDINDVFTINLKDEFIEDLKWAIIYHYNSHITSIYEIYKICKNDIYHAIDFENLQFNLDNTIEYVKLLNDRLFDEYYIIKR